MEMLIYIILFIIGFVFGGTVGYKVCECVLEARREITELKNNLKITTGMYEIEKKKNEDRKKVNIPID